MNEHEERAISALERIAAALESLDRKTTALANELPKANEWLESIAEGMEVDEENARLARVQRNKTKTR